MKNVINAALLCMGMIATPLAFADAKSTCERSAIEQKLNGAARDAHMKKCMADKGASEAAAMCERQANGLKLTGPNKDAQVRRCIAELLAPNR